MQNIYDFFADSFQTKENEMTQVKSICMND
jgi:hypothetical protein